MSTMIYCRTMKYAKNYVFICCLQIGTCVDYGKTLIGCFHGSSELQIGANGQVTLTSQLGEQKLRERNGKSDSIPSPSQYWSKCWQDFHFYKKEVLVPFKIAKKGEDEFILRNKQIHQVCSLPRYFIHGIFPFILLFGIKKIPKCIFFKSKIFY